jgi:hypothetical protein
MARSKSGRKIRNDAKVVSPVHLNHGALKEEVVLVMQSAGEGEGSTGVSRAKT